MVQLLILDELMNCFCGMVDRRMAFSLISNRDHCQRASPSRIPDTPRAGFEHTQKPKFRLSCMELCSSDNHYTMVPIGVTFPKLDYVELILNTQEHLPNFFSRRMKIAHKTNCK